MPQTSRIQWGQGRKEAFETWLQHEIDRARSARVGAEENWKAFMELYRAPANTGIAHFPFEGASARVFPFTSMNVDPILSMYMSNIHQAPNMWATQALNERWIQAAKPLQDV